MGDGNGKNLNLVRWKSGQYQFYDSIPAVWYWHMYGIILKFMEASCRFMKDSNIVTIIDLYAYFTYYKNEILKDNIPGLD